ncbi:ATPase family AAA domain-containing protein 5 isoform X2 [Pseudoliparis swirei]|uniref:ATPase family AAA domain-containing protein 5 isoform X2 n=1 Tax=Pseudoliparis swirei TaxID=2059687 RepID=UPI0024BD92CC|nr:ATPase family AAA domain-containing protein 5 isoform X2 [Pseudoliparis swirei]
MMAGVVAMASVIEDFDTQPCKKSRKDGGSPIVKTITNYFSPVPKPAEKPFSPPRSNSITDYFGHKTPSSKEKTSTPEQLKENCQTPEISEKPTGPEAAVKRQSQKQRRKASKAVRKLVEAEIFSSAEEASSPVVEKRHDSRDSADEAIGSCGLLGSETAALISQFSAEACAAATKTVSVEQFEEDGPKCGNNVKLNPLLTGIELSPIVPSKDKAKQVKTVARNSRKAKHSEPEKEKESSLCDVSMEVDVDEVSVLNNSTVTISFEDFVRSQSRGKGEEDTEDERGRGDESKISTEAEEMDTDQLAIPKAKESVASYQSPFQVSARTVTIQAEVHVISPKQEAAMAGGKLASIFTRRKGSMSPASSPRLEAEHQLPSSSLTVKRKSNVVLQEEDLELFVLESESMPKCSVVERKQFMAAFKQPSQDGSKCKTVKSQSKQKQPGDKAGDDADKVAEDVDAIPPSVEQVPATSQKYKVVKKRPARKGKKKAREEDEAAITIPSDADDAIPPSVEQVPATSQEDKVVKKRPARKGKRKAKEEDEAAITIPSDDDAAAVEETVAAVGDVDDEIEEIRITSTPSIPAVRRSKREAVVREAPELIPTSSIRKTRKCNESKDEAAAAAAAAAAPSASTNDSPANMSTQKRRRSKRTVFVAEMVCPPDTKESPIRIKFTRVHKNVPTTKPESGSGVNTSLATKTSNDFKKRRQAKKLVEKARVIQQSKKTADKEKSSVRRSSRNEASSKMRYCDDEDSVIYLEEDQTAPAKSKRRKPLRSLNEVLGKASVGKETKTVTGSKVASLGEEETARKASAVISIFDDSSPENSQDDEQFKARKEFLKSGLPESFRKQIAKTDASRETYSLSCSSFQPVIHIKQSSNDCPLWSLLWPESSLLVHLKEIWCQTSNSIPSVSGSFCVRTKPERRTFFERGSGWRPEISESVRQLLMEEVSASNPPFPAQMFTTRFLKRRADQQQSPASEAVTRVTSTTLPAEPVGGKRKRMDDEGGMSVKVAKKQRANCAEEKKSEPEPTKRGRRTRRARRASPEEEENALPSVETAPVPSDDDDSVVFIDDSPLGEKTGRKDVGREDVLWTDKYQPQHSSDIIGNTASVRRLHSWLKEWKLRADREERKKQKDKKQEEGSNDSDSDWDCGEEVSQDGEDMLCNTMLITGPTGIGKTAAVYACAQELGFKVFEVNASSQRSGRLILSQLKEATQSHQVDSQGVNAHKPTYFNSYGSSADTLKLGSSPRKVNSPRRVVSSPRKHPQSPRGAKRGSLAPTSLANFFKTGQPTKETPNDKKNDQTAASKKVLKANERANKKKDCKSAPTAKEKNNEEQSKKTATSLILFEEVDVIFDDDSGFLAAIKTFMTTTKRPVILTTSDPAFTTMFDGNFEEILFKTPSVLDVGSFLRLLCLAEDTRTDREDVGSLLRLNGCDIRQSLLQLQFWARSAGGRHVTRPLTHTIKHAELKPEADEESACAVTDTLPPCDTGCTESMLGLLNVEPDGDIWERLQSPVEEMCWELLANSKRRGVDLLYSNFEKLLPLPLTQLTTSTFKAEQSVSASQDRPSAKATEVPPHAGPLHTAESAECSDDGSPIKMSHRMRKSKKRHSLPGQDGLHSDSDSEDGFISLCKPQEAPQAKEDVKRSLVSEAVKRKPLTPEERVKSVPISQCLESIADFFDNMSYMDSLMVHPEGGDDPKRMPLVSAVVKDGMTDESRAESDRGSWERVTHVLEIPAAVEALSFHKCRVSVAAAWDKVQPLEGEVGQEAAAALTLPVAAHREGYSFTQDGPSQPQLVQRRREAMECLMLRGVFGTPANRQAAALDYLPALRTICKSEQLKEQGKVKRRFLHYLDAIHLGLDKSTRQQLAEDFP